MIKLKVCGLRDTDNILAIAALYPEYMGFIFYEKSKRYVGDDFVMPVLSSAIKKVGIFVNSPADVVIQKARKYALDCIQLHGDEPVGYCKAIKEQGLEVIKAFGIDKDFEFDQLKTYLSACDYFLFDTKSPQHGGSGKHFNWDVLKLHNIDKPFFLSGGIGLYDIADINVLAQSMTVHAVDINSKFEIEPAQKDVHEIEKFVKLMNSECL